MTSLLLLSAALAAIAYLFTALRAAQARDSGPVLLVLIAAVVLHSIVLIASVQAVGGRLGLTQALSLLTWQSALLLGLLSGVATLRPLRTAIYPLAAAGVALAAVWPTQPGGNAPHDWRIALHAALSIFAAGLLTLAAAQAIALDVLDRLLHKPDQLARVLRMPPMQASEDWLFQLIGAGFFVLSLALLSGLIFVDDLFAQHLVHKTVLSIIAWLIFAALLLGRRRWGWRGKRAVRWALSGYGALLLAYFGSKLVLEQILGRHWT
ncbi:MAG: cytochrome c biogenesis protein CcsA [Stagnimonas sp.]|nr:cytochrome c biogenesis protein CcsA [Stagnimonas sp.]